MDICLIVKVKIFEDFSRVHLGCSLTEPELPVISLRPLKAAQDIDLGLGNGPSVVILSRDVNLQNSCALDIFMP